jgi:citrate lyase beta subunit
MSGMERLRAWLFVPGNWPQRFARAIATPGCGVILDLEDAVVPEAKSAARSHVAAFLGAGERCGKPVGVRINPISTRAGFEDMLVLLDATAPPDYILVPKVEGPEPVALLSALLAEAKLATRIIALIESARGVAEAPRISDVGSGLSAIMFGAADYAADLGLDVGKFDPVHARATLVNAAAMNGLSAIDSPFFAIDDESGLADACRAARALGFRAKAAIHPAQIPTIIRSFAPDAADLAEAARILALSDGGASAIDGKMIDIAMLRWARTIVSDAS